MFNVALFMLLDLLLHLNLGEMSLSIVQFGFETCQGLCDFACSMGFSGFFLAPAFVSKGSARTKTFARNGRAVGHGVERILRC